MYEDAEPDDGVRVLVDRMWPRGLSRDAPSPSLRRWFGHDPSKFAEFRSRYRDELDTPSARTTLDRLRTLVEDGSLTLLTATRDVAHSHATVLADLLRETP